MKSLFKNLLLKNSSPKQIVFKNTLWMLGSDIIIRILKFLLIPIASRILQPEGFGIFNYSLTLVAAFFMLADLGLSTILRREYHQYDNRKPLITSVFFLKCLLWVMTVIVSSVAFFFLKDPVVKTLFFVFVGKYLFDEIKQFFLNLAIIQHRMELQAGILSMEAIIVTTVGLYFLVTTQSIFHFAIAYFLGSLVSVIVLLFFLKSLHFNIGKLEIKHIKKVSKLSFPFILVALVGMVYVSSDTLMIKWILGNEAVGYYTASFKLLGIISLSFAYIYKTITPLMNEVEISCLPKDLPERLEVDVEALELDDMLYLEDIVLPEGVEISLLTQEEPANEPIVAVRLLQIQEEPEVEELAEGEEGEEGIEAAAAGEEGSESSESEGESEDSKEE